jgi:hypothetical protein
MTGHSPRTWGAVRKLPSGRHQARWTDPEAGERPAAPDTFATKADADAWLGRLRVDHDQGEAPLIRAWSGDPPPSGFPDLAPPLPLVT